MAFLLLDSVYTKGDAEILVKSFEAWKGLIEELDKCLTTQKFNVGLRIPKSLDLLMLQPLVTSFYCIYS